MRVELGKEKENDQSIPHEEFYKGKEKDLWRPLDNKTQHTQKTPKSFNRITLHQWTMSLPEHLDYKI